MLITITLPNGDTETINIEIFQKTLSMAASMLRMHQREERKLPPLEQKTLDWVDGVRTRHMELI